jgi:hypothetical protein
MIGLQLTQRLTMQCDCCYGTTEEHDDRCPRKMLRDLFDGLRGPKCPVCYAGTLLVNETDYLECDKRACRAQFTRSEIAAGFDPDRLERKEVLDYDKNEHFAVLRIPRRGRGRFAFKKVQKNLRLGIRLAKATMRLARKGTR